MKCSILRGGTSRGVFFDASELPFDRTTVDRILLRVMGSPDRRQIDGLGGATSVTSKVAIIDRPSREDADVDYTFAQVAVDQAVVDRGGNCGNISSAVGPYAINHGFVSPVGPVTPVRIHNTNTGKIIVAHVPVVDGKAAIDGDCVIPGVPGSGARIMLDFLSPAGSVTGRLLPTGSPQDVFVLRDGRECTVSLVDAANPIVFARAHELGLTGAELPDELRARPGTLAVLEELRGIAAERLGLVGRAADAASQTPGLPKVGFVSSPAAYRTTSGAGVAAHEFDVAARLMSMQAPHPSYAVTGAICSAAAALVPGSVVAEAARISGDASRTTVRIGHPAGVMRTDVTRRVGADGEVELCGVAVERTAREIMIGSVCVPQHVVSAA